MILMFIGGLATMIIGAYVTMRAIISLVVVHEFDAKVSWATKLIIIVVMVCGFAIMLYGFNGISAVQKELFQRWNM